MRLINMPEILVSVDPGGRPGHPQMNDGRLGGLIRGCKKHRFLGFLTRAPGEPEAPGRPPGSLRGPSRGFRGASGCPRELQETEAKSLEA